MNPDKRTTTFAGDKGTRQTRTSKLKIDSRMHPKCIYSDKLHLCTFNEDKGQGTPLRKGKNSWMAEQLYEAILPLIPEDVVLKDLFLKWCELGKEDRKAVEEQVATPERVDLYTPLKNALAEWENLQDSQGAPGFEGGGGGYSFSCDSRLEQELLQVVYTMKNLIEGILFRYRNRLPLSPVTPGGTSTPNPGCRSSPDVIITPPAINFVNPTTVPSLKLKKTAPSPADKFRTANSKVHRAASDGNIFRL